MAVIFKPEVGLVVRHIGKRYIVVELTSLSEVLCRNLLSQETVSLPTLQIGPDESRELVEQTQSKTFDLATIPTEEWQEATEIMTLIRELTQKGRYRRTIADVEATAKRLGKSTKTIYRLLKKHETDGTIATFFRKERSDKGAGRLDEEVEETVMAAIRELLLKREFETFKDAHRYVKKICDAKKLKPPCMSVIRDRFLQINEKDRVARRQGKKVAQEKFTPLEGSFPDAEHPLDVVQIDHTPADLIIVDDLYRKPIGRPTLTIAIDVFSRVVMGFCLWLEAPGAATVGMCLSQAFLPKEKWLESRGLKANWPCYGRPRKIHTDNAKEFRGTVLGRACKNYGIDLEQRPKGRPNYGGNVERGFRTFLRKMHGVPGTTFSNTKSKFDYDSEGRAILTLGEFEFWFVTYITKIYLVEFHNGIKTAPLAKYQEGILGSEDRPGIGMPERFTDEERLRLDFLPFVERTVQEYGVRIDHIHYNDDILRLRIHEKDPENPRSARKFVFRRDPTDISVIYFWDPDLEVYKEIPTAHRGRPPVSLWEVRAAFREQIAKGRAAAAVNENLIYEAIMEMREIERDAAAKTKAARRNEQRRLEAEKKRKKKEAQETKPAAPKLTIVKSSGNPLPAPEAEPKNSPPPPISDGDDDVVQAFDDIDMRENYD